MKQHLVVFTVYTPSGQPLLSFFQNTFFSTLCLPPWIIIAFHLGCSMEITPHIHQKIAKIPQLSPLPRRITNLPNPQTAPSQGQNFSLPAFALYTDGSCPFLYWKKINHTSIFKPPKLSYFCVLDSSVFQLILLKTSHLSIVSIKTCIPLCMCMVFDLLVKAEPLPACLINQ